jgi:hypothetical protein
VDEEAKRRSMEQVRAHLARADSELEAAQTLLHPRIDDTSLRSPWCVLWPTPGLWLATHRRRSELGSGSERQANEAGRSRAGALRKRPGVGRVDRPLRPGKRPDQVIADDYRGLRPMRYLSRRSLRRPRSRSPLG